MPGVWKVSRLGNKRACRGLGEGVRGSLGRSVIMIAFVYFSILNTIKGLKKHMRFVHPKEPQSCKICFKKLKNPHTLWQHMTLSHKQPVKKRKIS